MMMMMVMMMMMNSTEKECLGEWISISNFLIRNTAILSSFL